MSEKFGEWLPQGAAYAGCLWARAALASAPSPMSLPLELWNIIAEQITDPTPRLYLQLALVSKHWHTVFLRDSLWQKFNVYEVDKDICSHYLEKVAEMNSERQAWHLNNHNDYLKYGVFEPEDPYSQLLAFITAWEHMTSRYLRDYCHDIVWQKWIKIPSLFEQIRPQRGSGLWDIRFRDLDRDSYLYLVRRGEVLELNKKYWEDHEVVLAMARFDGLILRKATTFASDREVAVACLAKTPRAYGLISEELRDDYEIIKLADKWSGKRKRVRERYRDFEDNHYGHSEDWFSRSE